MRRLQLFEFEDLSGFPPTLRDCMTDYLRYVEEAFDLFEPVLPVLEAELRRAGLHHVIDLASGGGGPWGTLAPKLRARVPDLGVTLTDLHPNAEAFAFGARRAGLTYEPSPVDATDVPARLHGLRTMFLSFHHLPPMPAIGVLRSAVESEAPIAIFEAQRRDVAHLLRFALSPLAVLALTPRIRPFRSSRLLLTYLPPLVPLLVGWDGVVSVLRTYSPAEMQTMAATADPHGRFEWETGELEGRAVVPYLVGRPVESVA